MFKETATTEIYTISLNDAIPIYIKKGIRNNINMKPLFK